MARFSRQNASSIFLSGRFVERSQTRKPRNETRREISHGGWVVTHAGLALNHLLLYGANQDKDFPRGSIAQRLRRVKLIILRYCFCNLPWVISECPTPFVDDNIAQGPLQTGLNPGTLALFWQF